MPTLRGVAADLRLRVRNETRELSRVAAEIEGFGGAHGLTDKDVFDVCLALDEVLTNVIWYAFDADTEREIDVHLALVDGELRIEVADDGRPFDPLSVPGVELDLELPAEERKIGGLGMHLVRHAMHSLEYHRHLDKNVLTMRRRVSRRES